MEIITGVERRRQWRDEEKLRILAELNEPGVKFSEVARRHDISRGLLWQWRDAQRHGRLAAETPGFLPLQVVPEMAAPAPPGGSGPPPYSGPAGGWGAPALACPCRSGGRAGRADRDRAAGRHRGARRCGDQRCDTAPR